MSNLIKYQEVSRILTGGSEGVRKNKVPKKHREAVEDLESRVEEWKKKYKRVK